MARNEVAMAYGALLRSNELGLVEYSYIEKLFSYESIALQVYGLLMECYQHINNFNLSETVSKIVRIFLMSEFNNDHDVFRN